jgi:hypothetical protein
VGEKLNKGTFLYFDMTLKKFITGVLTAALLFTGCAAKKLNAQNLDWYSNTKVESTTQTENNLIYSDNNASFGWNSVLKENEKPEHVFASKLDLGDRSRVYIHARSKEDYNSLEAKLNQKVGKKVTLDLGIGTDGLVHIGLEYGFLKSFGFGLSYVRDDNNEEFRGEIWKYWDDFLFTGIRKSNDKYHTVISIPRAGEFSARYFNITDFEDFTFNQLLLGKSRKGKYSLSYKDSWFLLQDSSIVGSESIRTGVKPFGYIVPPVAWRVTDYGLEITHIDGFGKKILDVEGVKYLDGKTWIGASYSSVDDYNKFGLMIGFTSDKLNLAISPTYDSNNKFGGNLILRIW